MDLAKFDTGQRSESGVEYTVLSPVDGKPTDVKITLAGVDSSYYKNQSKRQSEERLNKLKDSGEDDFTSEEIEKSGVEMLAACTLGWSGLVENGRPVKFSREEAVRIYSHSGYRWLRDQVDRFIGKRSNFFPVSPKVSNDTSDNERG